MNIAQQERLRTYRETLNNESYNSLQDRVAAAAKIKKEEDYYALYSFSNVEEMHFTKFVDERIFDRFFSNFDLDIRTVKNIFSQAKTDLNKLRDGAVNKYNNIKKSVNLLQSRLNNSALYDSAWFSNMRLVIETFDKTDDILVETKPLFIDLFEKRLMLPHVNAELIDLSRSSVIADGNGTTSNNVSNITDNNSATYFEYTQSTGVDKLALKVRINLPYSQIANQIIIEPNTFGAPVFPSIADIKISYDGVNFYSIKNNVFFNYNLLSANTENDPIILNPANNKNNDRFIFDFLASSIIAFEIAFEQNVLHPFSNDFKIGINNIFLRRVTFAEAGSVIVKKELPLSSIKSLAIKSIGYTKQSPILPINYEISTDGNTWISIQPMNYEGNGKEVVQFNQPWLPESKNLDAEIGDIFIRISMSKNTDPAILQNILENQSLYQRTEMKNITGFPAQFQLSKPPGNGTLDLFYGPFLRVGSSNNTFVIGKTAPEQYLYTFDFPFTITSTSDIVIETVNSKGDIINVAIQKFSGKADLLNKKVPGYYYDADNNKLFVYVPNFNNDSHQLDFHDLDNEYIIYSNEDKKAYYENMFQNRSIKLVLEGEEFGEDKKTLKLNYFTDRIKENITVKKTKYVDGSISSVNIKDMIPAGETSIVLSHVPQRGVANKPVKIEGGYEVEFKDGFSEFVGQDAYAFSVDYTNNIIYLRDAYDVDTTVDYWHLEQYTLKQDDFELKFEDDGHTILVKDYVYASGFRFSAEYNMEVKLPEEYYSVLDNTVTVNSLPITAGEKYLRFIYKYQDTPTSLISEVGSYLSPILNELQIIYTV